MIFEQQRCHEFLVSYRDGSTKVLTAVHESHAWAISSQLWPDFAIVSVKKLNNGTPF